MSKPTPQYPPGTYVKGDTSRVAHSSAVAVALVFDGYSLAQTETKADPAKVQAPVTEDANLNPNARPKPPAEKKD